MRYIDYSMWNHLRYEAINMGRNFEILYGEQGAIAVPLDGKGNINTDVDSHFLGGYENGWLKFSKLEKEDLWNAHLEREVKNGFLPPIKNRWEFLL